LAPRRKRRLLKGLLDNYLLELGMLEDACITPRYVMRESRKEEVERLRKAVEEVIEKCRMKS